ncbi:hypothetical protein VDG05_07715, partial [Xanthomonas campestris pv. raphani]|uniref:hypothetical protein n=1 Tax=Xanthomonas campestris TaxID=339 RepID=UPI002B231280
PTSGKHRYHQPRTLNPTATQGGGTSPVTSAAADSKRYGASAPLTSEWAYSFGMDQTPTAGRWFEFTFIPAQAGASPPMTEICRIDFDTFTKKLENAGFVRQRNMVEDGRWMSDFFSRPGMRVEVFPRGESDAPQERVEHHCVEWIYIRSNNGSTNNGSRFTSTAAWPSPNQKERDQIHLRKST